MLFLYENRGLIGPCHLHSFINLINILGNFLCNNGRSNILMLCKEDDHLIAGNLDAHITADRRVCDNDANK